MLNQALSAALAEFFQDASSYRAIYQKYLGLEPRFVPPTAQVEWPRELGLSELRLGYCHNPPYQFTGPGGGQEGLDYDLGLALVGILSRRYGPLRLSWVEKVPRRSADEQVAMYEALIAGLRAGEFDAALSGLLRLEGQPVRWAIPSTLLFTGIFYTGRDGLDLAALSHGSRDQLVAFLAGHPETEFSFMATVNPGPSATSNDELVARVVAAGGRARAVHGTVAELQQAMREAPVHFVVGDAVSLSYFANQPGFRGVNLDMPARDGVLPLAPFTL